MKLRGKGWKREVNEMKLRGKGWKREVNEIERERVEERRE